MDYIANEIKRAYHDAAYGITKAALEPVVAAMGDVLREAISESLKDGIKDAVSSTDFIGDLIFGRRKRK